MFPNLARLEFLAGGAAAAALVACGGKTSYVTPTVSAAKLSGDNDNAELARLMRKAGVLAAVSHGVVYRADGKQFGPVPGNVGIRPSTIGEVDGDGGVSGASPRPSPPPTIDWVFSNGSRLSMCPFSSYDVSGTALQFIGPAGPGDTYVIDTSQQEQCTNPIQEIAELADQVVNYIENNAGNFGSALVSAASGAAVGWQGTAMGTAAAGDAAAGFLTVVFAGCGIGEILIMLAALGVALFLVYELIKCATGH